MHQTPQSIFADLLARYPALDKCSAEVMKAFQKIAQCYAGGGKLLLCGNGGSAADCDHIAGELLKGFLLKRPLPRQDIERLVKALPQDSQRLSANLQRALPAFDLTNNSALVSAFANDVEAGMVYAQQVYAVGKPGDVLLALSTSGNAVNVINAVKVACAFGLSTIGLSGKTGGQLSSLCDIVIRVPEEQTFRVQEYHLPIYHALCAMLEAEFFADSE